MFAEYVPILDGFPRFFVISDLSIPNHLLPTNFDIRPTSFPHNFPDDIARTWYFRTSLSDFESC